MATLRVHTLAKELGVPSKVIIDKCRAEGVELKNHMAAISVGLAESIREWFSPSAPHHTVEVAEPVDLEKVRVRPKRDAGPHDDGGDAVAVAEAPLDGAAGEALHEPVAPFTFQPALEPEAPAEPEPPAEAPPLRVAAEHAPVDSPPEIAVEAPPEPQIATPEAPAAPPAVEEPEAPDLAAQVEPPPAPAAPEPPPEPVRPAGPKLVPAKAELKGPRIVRIEAPEPAPAPRSRPAATLERPPAAGESGTALGRKPARGKTARTREEEEAARLRSRSPRRHGSASDVDQRMREWREADLLERKERLASATGSGLRERRAAERRRHTQAPSPAAAPGQRRPVEVVAPIAVKEFCAAIGTPFPVIAKKLMEQTGALWTINQSLDAETAELVAMELGVPITVVKPKTAYELLEDEFAARERPKLEPRPPVVAMLGHVDHGKTSLLDAIRKTNVAAGEAGGITQHIGAYRIDRGDWHVTFLDTPGHQAFTAMRARGAHMTDVVVLVIAADDGPMPQTLEALSHARAAGVQIVVALNKTDLPGIDFNRIYAQLAEHELTPTEWGGSTDVIKTSATKGQGIDDLIAHLSTLAELLDLKADPTVPAAGVVIESQMREGQGVVAQVLVREGTLKPGQVVVCGPGAGRVRLLRDDRNQRIEAAGPSTPVEVTGLDELPEAGDKLFVVSDLARAKAIAREVRETRRAAAMQVVQKPRTLESLFSSAAAAEIPELPIIVRADVQGSVDVLKETLSQIPADRAALKLLHAAVGAISEADVHLAQASGAIIVGFHVVPEERARALADQVGVEVRQYRVIYELVDDVKKALSGLLAPVSKEEHRGNVEVRQVFNLSKYGTVAGCFVTEGTVARNHRVRLVRDGRIITENLGIESLKRFKDDTREVRAGMECGIKLENYTDIKVGDVLQTYDMVDVAQSI